VLSWVPFSALPDARIWAADCVIDLKAGWTSSTYYLLDTGVLQATCTWPWPSLNRVIGLKSLPGSCTSFARETNQVVSHQRGPSPGLSPLRRSPGWATNLPTQRRWQNVRGMSFSPGRQHPFWMRCHCCGPSTATSGNARLLIGAVECCRPLIASISPLASQNLQPNWGCWGVGCQITYQQQNEDASCTSSLPLLAQSGDGQHVSGWDGLASVAVSTSVELTGPSSGV